MDKNQPTWTNKKAPMNPDKKEQHQQRKAKRTLQHHLEDTEWNKQLKEFYAEPNE